MTLYEEVKTKLEQHPIFRERSQRSIGLVKLALRKCGLEGRHDRNEVISLSELADFAVTFDSYRHAWGDVTRENPELRGSDYWEKEKLEQEKKLSLGYEPSYYQNLEKLSTLN